MLRNLTVWMACMGLAGCKGDPPRTYTAPPPPAILEYIMKAGDNLEKIAGEAYGHGRYSVLIAQHNRIENETRIQIGQRISTPGIVEMFRSAGLESRFDDDITALAWAVAEYHLALPSYTAIRQRSDDTKAGHLQLPKEDAGRLASVADAVEFAIKDIEEKTKPTMQAPSKSLAQLREALGHLRGLAKGDTDGYYYDVDLVDQRLAHGLRGLYVWTIETHR